MSDPLLYHYTTVFAFNEIVVRKTLWASDCRFLNDRLEWKEASTRFVELIEDKKRKEAVRVALEISFLMNHYCIISLSKSPRVLSQWRSYAEGGRGICFGLTEDYLKTSPWSDACDLRECVYDNHEEYLRTLFKKSQDVLAKIEEAYFVTCGHAYNVFGNWVTDNGAILDGLIGSLLAVKNGNFREELEWRAIVKVGYESIKTRVSDGLIIPYTELRLWKDRPQTLWIMMPEVWLGPKTAERNLDAIRCYKQFGLKIERYDCGLL